MKKNGLDDNALFFILQKIICYHTFFSKIFNEKDLVFFGCIKYMKNTTNLSQKVLNNFYCEKCDYKCFYKRDWEKHLLTKKHNTTNTTKKSHECECGKKYMHRASLHNHKKRCSYHKKVDQEDESIFVSKEQNNEGLILKVLDENKELRKMIIQQQEQVISQQKELSKQNEQISELIPKVGNNNNNRFNLNFFLNEQCKDAINWDDFIKSIEVGICNLDMTLDSNITKGVAQVICNGINELGIYKRPIHCLDAKRKKLCIKNEGTWEQDIVKNKMVLESGNRALQQKHFQLIKQWEKKHPNWEKSEQETNQYMLMIQKMMADVDEDKCIAEISKNALIPKEV